jgi:hypothetical protein
MKSSKKATPSLPSSSRMQMPMSSGSGMASKMKPSAGAKKGATTKKVMATASKGGKMAKKTY